MSDEKVGGDDDVVAFASLPVLVRLPLPQHSFLLSSSRLLIPYTLYQKTQGFDTIALHGGYHPDPSTVVGLGQGAPLGIPVYRTTPYVFKNTEHAANLFKLKELGNIYSRLVSTQ